MSKKKLTCILGVLVVPLMLSGCGSTPHHTHTKTAQKTNVSIPKHKTPNYTIPRQNASVHYIGTSEHTDNMANNVSSKSSQKLQNKTLAIQQQKVDDYLKHTFNINNPYKVHTSTSSSMAETRVGQQTFSVTTTITYVKASLN